MLTYPNNLCSNFFIYNNVLCNYDFWNLSLCLFTVSIYQVGTPQFYIKKRSCNLFLKIICIGQGDSELMVT